MKQNNPLSKNDQPRFSPRLWIIVGALLLTTLALTLFNDNESSMSRAATLPEIVSAIENGEVEALTVRGDQVTATITDGEMLRALKESNISTFEALQLQRAKDTLVKQHHRLESLSEALLRYETIDRPEFEALMT